MGNMLSNADKKIYFVAAALLFIAGCSIYPYRIVSYFAGGASAPSATPYEPSFYAVKKNDHRIELKASGRLECINELGVTVPDGIWGARIEKLAAEGEIVNSGEVVCQLNTAIIEDGLNRAQTELSNCENELEEARMINELEEMSKRVEIAKKNLQYELNLFKLGVIKKGADTIEVALCKIGIEKNAALIANFDSKLKSQKELLKKGFLSSFQFAELELEYQRNMLELEQNRNKLEALRELPSVEEVKKLSATVDKLEFDRTLTAQEYETIRKLNKIEVEKKELNINEKKHRVAQAQAMIDKARLSAPIGGTLIYSNGWIGKTRVGMEVWSGLEILKIVDLKNMKIIAKVNEKYIDKFREGAAARITLNCLPERTLAGFVRSVSRLARLKDERDPKGPKEFDVTVYFSDTCDVKLVPNMSADISILCAALPATVRIPKDFEEEGVIRTEGPQMTIEIEKAKNLRARRENEKAPAGVTQFVFAGEDDDYYYFFSPLDEFKVRIPHKGNDTIEVGI